MRRMGRFSFEQRLAEAWPPDAWCGMTVLVAGSAAQDSVALLEGLTSAKDPGDSLTRGSWSPTTSPSTARSDADRGLRGALAAQLDLACESYAAPATLDLRDGLESVRADAPI